MNIIKYLHPGTGEIHRIRALQTPPHKMDFRARRHGWMAEVDAIMYKRGFVRCGIRRGKVQHIKTARRLEEKEKTLAKS